MKNDKWLEEIDRKVEEERRAYRGPHCCMTMHYELLSEASLLIYNIQWREYGIKLYRPNTGYLLMQYCTDCGTKLPDSLKNMWFNILKEEYFLIDPIENDKELIPEKFLTDEWWNPNRIFNSYRGNQEVSRNIKIKSNITHCCDALDYELLNKTSVLMYSPKYREYNIKLPSFPGGAAMDYCLFCGQQFPFSVRCEWFDILREEYQLESPCEGDKKKVPAQFWTDEWWKNRGL